MSGDEIDDLGIGFVQCELSQSFSSSSCSLTMT